MKEARPSLVCLLPVRNAAPVLAEWLDEVARFADAVVALDDGSTDDTGAILRAHPLVANVLTNERRESYFGWHDGENRNRLLVAAGELQPTWILSLDVDERIDPTDAEALRRFVATEALPGCAYGFEWYRMLDGQTYELGFATVFRLFAFRKGQRFENRRLWLAPVPVDIPPERWIMTTLRIKHFGELGDEGRRARVLKYGEADPDVTEPPHPAWKEVAPGPHPRWGPRDSSLPLLAVAAADASTPEPARIADARAALGGARPGLVCLLPARDCLELLPGYFASVGCFADAVVALDDGSTDGTTEYLREHPLVVMLLENPPRDGYGGWNDSENRNRLLAAAAELSPDWIISLDADERVPLEDGVGLRRFLRDEAKPGYGYGLPLYRMIGDEDHYDRLEFNALRLFAFEPGQVFASDRLHLWPVPTSIPVERLQPTTFRIKHLNALTDSDRRARWDKYREADPTVRWERDYTYTVEPQGEIKEWPTRPLSLPGVRPTSPMDLSDEDEYLMLGGPDLSLDGPVLSVVFVVEPGDERPAVTTLQALAAGTDDTVELLALTRDEYCRDVLRRELTGVTVRNVLPELSPGALRNAALRLARGDYVSFLSGADQLGVEALEAVIAAHEAGHGVVGARAESLASTPAGRAKFALDCVSLEPQGRQPTTAVYFSFARERLLAIDGFDPKLQQGFEGVAATRLLRYGLTAALVSDLFLGYRAESSVADLLRDRFLVGRGLARGRHASDQAVRVGLVALSVELARLTGSRRSVGDRRFSTPGPAERALVAAGAVATWLGSVVQAFKSLTIE